MDELKDKFPVKMLAKYMKINRSSYYKWAKNKGKEDKHMKRRMELTALIRKEHEKWPSHGYHRLAEDVLRSTGWKVSHNLVHKCCKAAGIKSKARKYGNKKANRVHGKENIRFPNLVRGNWNVEKPLVLVASDMTTIRNIYGNWEWTLILDAFNNGIVAHSYSQKRGDAKPYYKCLDRLKHLVGTEKEQKTPTILHTDQGSVYSSQGFYESHKDYNIVHSMSRRATPTDNAVIESMNGWIKEELYRDFNAYTEKNIPQLLDRYVEYYNNERLAFSLGYMSPEEYKKSKSF